MNKITVKISAIDKKKLNLKSNKIDFVDLERLIMLSAAPENLKKVVNVARKTGLSKMTSKKIDAEIKPYRESSKAGN